MQHAKVRIAPYRMGQAGRRFRPIAFVLLALYSALTGVGIAVLPPQLLFILALPILIAVGVILWMLPDAHIRVPVDTLANLFIAFIFVNCLWPNYIAINLPGLPWINPTRVVVFALLAVGLYNFATSKQMRTEISASMTAIPWLNRVFWLFWGVTLVTLVMSADIAFSANRWANNQIFWTMLFVFSAWLGTKPDIMKRVVSVLVWTAILVSVESIYEYHIQQVPWLDHIPSWLKVDDQYLDRILKGGTRAGTDVYRARGTFSVSLILAEYLAMVFPFIIHLAVISKETWKKAALGMGLLATVSAMWLTGARSGMVGFFLAVFLYGAFAIFRHWRRRRDSLIGISALVMLPIAAVAFLGLAITWPRLHSMTIGGGQHQPSTEAREAQWAMGWPKVLSNPIGHGTSRSGETLGFRNAKGVVTVDTYYLSVLLDYGVAGYVLFMVMFGGQAVPGLRMYMSAADDDYEESLTGPATIALLNFLVIKLVLSSEFNLPIAFIFLGMLFSVARRRQLREQLPQLMSPALQARAIQGRLLPAQ